MKVKAGTIPISIEVGIIAICFVIVFVAFIGFHVDNSPGNEETGASGYKFAYDLVDISCPAKAHELDALIVDDGILSRNDLSAFHTSCDADRRDRKKQELIDKLRK